jgi:hypothetical protein
MTGTPKASSDDVAHRPAQAHGIEWLADPRAEAILASPRVFGTAQRSQCDHGYRGQPCCCELLGKPVAVLPRHRDVGDHHVRRDQSRFVERLPGF